MKHSLIKTKAPALVLAVLMAMLLLTGCTKTPSTTENFKQIAQEKGYLMEDAISQFAAYSDIIKEATVVAPKSISFKIEFYVLSDETQAKSFYANNLATLEANIGSVYSGSSLSGKNYASRSITSDGKYMFIERVENTVLYVSPTDSGNKSEIEAFIKSMGY